MSMQPYKFEPLYKQRIWGGWELAPRFGKRLWQSPAIGEMWCLADLPQGDSRVANGPDAGKGLAALLAEKGGDILGEARALPDGRFPLLLKLLAAAERLSLQVHPDAAAAALGPPAAMKTECWYVLESCDGYILKGCKAGVTEADFRRALAAGDNAGALTELVERYEVRPGEFHYLPAGTVHALGPGVVVAEVQTPSDTTFRVSDWGRGRPVHVDQALRCIHYNPAPATPGAEGDVLVRSEHFTVRRLVRPIGESAVPAGECVAWMVLAGAGEIRSGSDEAVSVSAPETVLLPAAMGPAALAVAEDMTILEVALPR